MMHKTKDIELIKNIEHIFVSNAMKQVINSLKLFAQNEEPVFLEGESGTGKDTFAYFMYLHYPKTPKFIHTVNCYALTDTILIDMLNSFINQNEDNNEKITFMLYFNDILELGMSAQTYLLHFLEDFESNKTNRLIKIISSTTKSLQELVDSNFSKFKSELYYRISSQIIYIPPLREHTDDLLPLIKFFMNEFHTDFILNSEVEDILINYPWPGNMRELANTIKQLSLLGIQKICKNHLPQTITRYFER